MTKRLLKLVVMALVTGPMVGAAGPLGPIVVPTGPGEDPDSTEIGDPPPDDPKDQGNLLPEGRLLASGGDAVAVGARASGPILLPTGPGEDPEDPGIGEEPPRDPVDTGGIRPRR